MPRATWDAHRELNRFNLRGFYLLWLHFPVGFGYLRSFLLSDGFDVPSDESHNPSTATASTFNTALVWAVPVSLAATQGITIVFYSSRY